MSIQVLDQNTINKIAAGEVIERPASVVKELVENAIDAKATAITIEIKEGGISFVRITDNGSGIQGKELPTAFLRHATSKIKSIEDLACVGSLGFRGEALSSIAAISQIELITKTSDSFNGYRYVIEGGKEISMEEIGAPDGTTFIVRNLFYNTPVRRKFLKTAPTEAGYVNALIEHLALSHPDVSFRFINNNQNKLHTSGNSNLKDIVYHVYGRDICNNLIILEDKTQDVVMTGFIGKPAISRGNRTYENYYINGRYIKSSIITKAIEEAYKGFVMMHNYPFTAIHFTINPEIMDVNVHPTKMELRFSQNEFIYNFVLHAVRNALTKRELIPNVELVDVKEKVIVSPPKPTETTANKVIEPVANKVIEPVANKVIEPVANKVMEPAVKPAAEPTIKPAMEVTKNTEPVVISSSKERLPEPFEIKRSEQLLKEDNLTQQYSSNSKPEQLSLFGQEDKLLDKKNTQQVKIIGQLFDTYWLIEFEEKFFIMDQHAAHEKVLFEKMMKELKCKKMDSQMIAPPIVLSLNMREEQVLNDNLKLFQDFGYEIEEFGGNEYKVTGIPASLPTINNNRLLIDILDGLVDENLSQRPELIIEKVASMSCKAAVKGNNTLSITEAKKLMDDLMQADNPYNCPHGRPTLIAMTKYEIEKKFKRII